MYIFPPDYFYYWYCLEFSILLGYISLGKVPQLVTVDNLQGTWRRNVAGQYKNTPWALKSHFYWLIKGNFLFISLRFLGSFCFYFLLFFPLLFFPPTGLERFHLNEHSGSIVRLGDETCRRQLSRDVLRLSCHRGTEGRSEGKGFDGREKRTWRLRGERQGTERMEEEEDEGPMWLCFPEREAKEGCIIKKQRLFFSFFHLYCFPFFAFSLI